MSRTFVGITGASGHRYSEVLIRALVAAGQMVDLSISGAGCKVLQHELRIDAGRQGEKLATALPAWLGAEVASHVRCYRSDEVGAPAASGTAGTGAMVIAPCSMGTLARIVAGFSSNLVERAADVALKEGRTLIVMPRETPLSEVHLRNMLELARLGGIVLPCMPGFYHHPESLDDLVSHVVGKVLDRLGLHHTIGARWQGLDDPPAEPGTTLSEGGSGS